ncbi:MAG: helix-turn-helix domain-containing protein [Nitrospiraceae bacterium]|nr:helix-turn-helix domain-containing protein [Nitrospiraceae bacterium]
MKTELEAHDLDLIVSRVIEAIKPLLLARNGGEDALMTIDETAKFLKTSKAQIYQWVNNSQHGLGTFPYLKAGKLLRFSRNALLKWLEGR